MLSLCPLLFPSRPLFSLGIYPEAELLNCNSILVFEELPCCYIVFPNGYTNLHFQQQCTRDVFFPMSSPACVIFYLLGDSHSNRGEVISHGFDCIS